MPGLMHRHSAHLVRTQSRCGIRASRSSRYFGKEISLVDLAPVAPRTSIRPADKEFDVRAGQSKRELRKLSRCNIRCELIPLFVRLEIVLEDFLQTVDVRQWDIHNLIESSCALQRRIDVIRVVGCSNDNHWSSDVESLNLLE